MIPDIITSKLNVLATQDLGEWLNALHDTHKIIDEELPNLKLLLQFGGLIAYMCRQRKDELSGDKLALYEAVIKLWDDLCIKCASLLRSP